LNPRPLRIGAVHTDHWFQPSLSTIRAVDEAAEALSRAGHEVVKVDLPMNGRWGRRVVELM
jgi:Asp-tRNA(Asn)/Glu-tRNA(Gln) amidotransferase A subunit family amidase